MILWELFQTFLVIGFVSFGGGYAMMVPISHQVAAHGWMTSQEFADAFAVAGMSPGPIATNSAIFVGYRVAGIPGAVVSTLGMVLPSLILVLLIAAFFYRFHHNKWIQAAFYGLRAIITGLILYGAIRYGLENGILTMEITWTVWISVAIFAASLYALFMKRMHPFYVIALSGLVGMAVYG